MANYAIGDIQGCYRSLMALLDKIKFNPQQDTLWCVGDLVNRGPGSLKTLEYLMSLGRHAKIILGNHDLFLLAVYYDVWPSHPTATIKDITQSPKAAEMINWLRQQPLIYTDEKLGYTMTHAGIYPLWSLEQTQNYAQEVHNVLISDKAPEFLKHMYGNNPNIWSDDLEGYERIRFIVNALTRMRYVSEEGRLDLHHKEDLHHSPQGLIPWFMHPDFELPSNIKCLFGHWASLGGHFTESSQVIGLDTGCVWGYELTAMRLEDGAVYTVPAQE